jgi:hypothetical protein
VITRSALTLPMPDTLGLLVHLGAIRYPT